MKMRIFVERRKKIWIAGIAAAVLLFSLYLYALLQPGIWHEDTFLYRQRDGSFSGRGYLMIIDRDDGGASITFTAGDETRQYRIDVDGQDVLIAQNGELIFDGKYSGGLLFDADGELLFSIGIGTGDMVQTPEYRFPSMLTLYDWGIKGERDTRGEPMMLILIVFALAILALDIAFPDLFFNLRYRQMVYGGEPSDWYRTTQKFGRVIIV